MQHKTNRSFFILLMLYHVAQNKLQFFYITNVIPCGTKQILVTAPKYRDTSYFLFE